ncbi:MAG: helix-turn-helix domain-containing protein, partial [Ignavibacteria bacterium]
EISLTKKEFDILVYLISNTKRVLTKESIAEHIWGDFADSYDKFDFVYTHVKNLRKKLSDAGCKDYIRSVYGTGYKLSEE